MERWVGKVAVVTGASAGIGAAIAEALVNAGLKVAGFARRKNRVEELARNLGGKPGKLYAVQGDITKEDEVIKAFDYIKKNIGPISILVNNAGVLLNTTDLAHGKTDIWKQTFNVNVIGLLIATREAIKSMEESRIDGHIININSIGGHAVLNFPNMNITPASKFAVTALTETLRQELDATASKIKITSLSPGGVKTGIMTAANPSPEFQEIMKPYLDQMNMLEPADIGEAVLYVLGTPPHVQIRELMITPFDPPRRDFSK